MNLMKRWQHKNLSFPRRRESRIYEQTLNLYVGKIEEYRYWIPAFAGMTVEYIVRISELSESLAA